MNIKPLPLAAVAAASVLATMAIADAIWNATATGQPGPWADPESHEPLTRALSLAHSAVYAVFASALITTGRGIDRGRPLVRVLRWILVGGYAMFTISFLWLGGVDPRHQPENLLAGVVNVAFLVTLVVPVVLGFALIRRRELRAAVLLLIAPAVLLPVTVVLGAIGPWGHPAYVETAVGFGVALLCVGASAAADVPASSAATAHRARARLVAKGS